MKKWFDEDYEFELEVRSFLRGDKTEGIAEMAKKSATATNAPMVAPRIHKGKAFARK